jgi:hypothetical protein
MDVTVAIGAERNQILVCVITQSAPRANVVDLKMIGAATGLALQPSRSNTSVRSLR